MTLCLLGFTIQRKLDYICRLNIFLMYNFELLWPGLVLSKEAQLTEDWLIYIKMNFLPLLIFKILGFQKLITIWSVKSILDNNLRPRILPDMESGMESQASAWYSIETVLKKMKIFSKKIQNSLLCGHFCLNTCKKEIFANVRLSFLRCLNNVT